MLGRRRGKRIIRWAVVGAAVVVLGGCGDDEEPVALVEGETAEIASTDNTFRPEAVEVAAGTEVVWENRGRNAHNVLPVEGEDWGVEAGDFGPKATYTHRFTEPGTYDYYCSLHGTKTAGMVGTIEVTG